MQQLQTNNLAIAHRFMERFIGANNAAVADEVVAPDVIAITGLSPQGPIHGREAYKAAIASLHAGFPDLELTIEDSFVSAEGDRVVIRIRSVGTHLSEIMGLAPTHQKITFIETHVIRLQDSKVAENYVSATNLEFEMLFADVLRPLVLPEVFRAWELKEIQS